MTTQTTRTGWERLFVGLAAWMGLCCAVSCSSSDQAPAGGRVEHPDPAPAPAPTPTSLAPSPAPTPETPAPPEVEEQRPKTLAEDDPARPWSKNVPKRRCKKDDECGDGFCDRGRCAAIWTYIAQYGQPCEGTPDRGSLPCIDGRYRSCVSDAECAWSKMQDPVCHPDVFFDPGGRQCGGVIPNFLPPRP
jgi:hypothetical protein